MRWKMFFLIVFSITLLGCVAVKKSLDNYEGCKGDPVCISQMNDVKTKAYVVTKAATGPLLPSTSEIVAVIVSNIAAFGFGVFHGKKKGG